MIDALAAQHHQSVFHNMRFDERKRSAGLVSEDVDREVKLRLVRQQHLQTGVLIPQKWLAFDVPLVPDQRRRLPEPSQCLVRLLKNEQAAAPAATLDLQVLARGNVSVTARLEPMSPLLQHNAYV